VKVGDMGVDGRIYPISSIPQGRGHEEQFAFMDHWSPVQVKQKDKLGRPDVDAFEAVMERENRSRGFLVSFDYSPEALREIRRYELKSGRRIIAPTVKDLLLMEAEEPPKKKPPRSEGAPRTMPLFGTR
jgi:hypothetical protein